LEKTKWARFKGDLSNLGVARERFGFCGVRKNCKNSTKKRREEEQRELITKSKKNGK
jgi:hypothetical protein